MLSDRTAENTSLEEVVERINDEANEMGAEGWEMVSHSVTNVYWPGWPTTLRGGQVYYFVSVAMKRPKAEG